MKVPTREERRQIAREYALRSRAEQGLGPTVTDPEVVRKIALLFRVSRDERERRDTGVTRDDGYGR